MTDPRWQDLASILVRYSTRTGPGDNVLITMMEVETFPLARTVYAEAVRAGAFPHIQFASALLDRELMKYGSLDQIGHVPDMEASAMEWADVYIGLRGARNPFESAGIEAERIAAHRKAMGEISAMRNKSTRWVLIRVPNESFAQQAELSTDEMMAFFFDATLKDWAAEAERYHALQSIFQAGCTVRLIGHETDITFSTAGRQYVVGDGRMNMPDGEIFTAPVDDSANGYIYFDFPGVYGGKKIEGIRLELQSGRIISATSATNHDLLCEIIAIDEGADRLGEFGVGTNQGITRFVGDILYDEKIGGTVHLAIGRAYHECGGVNHSAVHWDIIKDLRQEGAIFLDGKKVFENGTWLIDW